MHEFHWMCPIINAGSLELMNAAWEDAIKGKKRLYLSMATRFDSYH
jgi:hypothetical protein